MTRVKRFLTVLAVAIAVAGLSAVPASADNHVASPGPSQPAGL